MRKRVSLLLAVVLLATVLTGCVEDVREGVCEGVWYRTTVTYEKRQLCQVPEYTKVWSYKLGWHNEVAYSYEEYRWVDAPSLTQTHTDWGMDYVLPDELTYDDVRVKSRTVAYFVKIKASDGTVYDYRVTGDKAKGYVHQVGEPLQYRVFTDILGNEEIVGIRHVQVGD